MTSQPVCSILLIVSSLYLPTHACTRRGTVLGSSSTLAKSVSLKFKARSMTCSGMVPVEATACSTTTLCLGGSSAVVLSCSAAATRTQSLVLQASQQAMPRHAGKPPPYPCHQCRICTIRNQGLDDFDCYVALSPGGKHERSLLGLWALIVSMSATSSADTPPTPRHQANTRSDTYLVPRIRVCLCIQQGPNRAVGATCRCMVQRRPNLSHVYRL